MEPNHLKLHENFSQNNTIFCTGHGLAKEIYTCTIVFACSRSWVHTEEKRFPSRKSGSTSQRLSNVSLEACYSCIKFCVNQFVPRCYSLGALSWRIEFLLQRNLFHKMKHHRNVCSYQVTVQLTAVPLDRVVSRFTRGFNGCFHSVIRQ